MCSVHFEDSTDEEDAPAAGDGPDDPDDDDLDDDDDGEDKDWTAIYMMEQQADMPDYVVTKADRRLGKAYGDHPRSNAGTHFSGGVDQDKLWQGRWLETMQLATTTYTVPKGQQLKFIHDWQCTNSQKFKFTKSDNAAVGPCRSNILQ